MATLANQLATPHCRLPPGRPPLAQADPRLDIIATDCVQAAVLDTRRTWSNAPRPQRPVQLVPRVSFGAGDNHGPWARARAPLSRGLAPRSIRSRRAPGHEPLTSTSAAAASPSSFPPHYLDFPRPVKMARSPLSRRSLLLLALSAFALILTFSPVAVADAGKEDVSCSSPSLLPSRQPSPAHGDAGGVI